MCPSTAASTSRKARIKSRCALLCRAHEISLRDRLKRSLGVNARPWISQCSAAITGHHGATDCTLPTNILVVCVDFG
jgi:hypothetical protein